MRYLLQRRRRQCWIENKLHCVRGVVFGEDASTTCIPLCRRLGL